MARNKQMAKRSTGGCALHIVPGSAVSARMTATSTALVRPQFAGEGENVSIHLCSEPGTKQ